MIDRPDNINIFILYAQEDEALKKELEDHLGFLQRLGYIDVWHEGQVAPGLEKEAIVAEYLDKAHIILLLISANFLAPDHYTKYEAELRRAYERQQEGKVTVIPVILRHCMWQLGMLAGLNPLPSGGHPVRSDHWESPDKAFHDITVALQKLTSQKMASDIMIVDDAPVATESTEENTARGLSSIEFSGRTANDVEEDQQAALKPMSFAAMPVAKEGAIPEREAGSEQERLLVDLFGVLYSQPIGEALTSFCNIAHRSLLQNGVLDQYFRQYNFDVAYERARQYVFPPVVESIKPSGRLRIGRRKDKDEGEEFVLTLKRVSATGSMPGQVRIFRSNVDNVWRISGLSL